MFQTTSKVFEKNTVRSQNKPIKYFITDLRRILSVKLTIRCEKNYTYVLRSNHALFRSRDNILEKRFFSHHNFRILELGYWLSASRKHTAQQKDRHNFFRERPKWSHWDKISSDFSKVYYLHFWRVNAEYFEGISNSTIMKRCEKTGKNVKLKNLFLFKVLAARRSKIYAEKKKITISLVVNYLK